jgi:hypothetical protein
MVAVLTRLFGVHNLALAEDVVQDAFCRALEGWSFRGVPGNPAAWLMAAAKNRALDALRRERTARTDLRRAAGGTAAMNEFCAREIMPRASKAYFKEAPTRSALRLPTRWATTPGRFGSPVRNPGKTVQIPKRSPAHFNHGKRLSRGDCSGKTAKKDRRADTASRKTPREKQTQMRGVEERWPRD